MKNQVDVTKLAKYVKANGNPAGQRRERENKYVQNKTPRGDYRTSNGPWVNLNR